MSNSYCAKMTESAEQLSEALDLVVDEYAAKLTSHEIITAIECVLSGVKKDAQSY